MVEPRMNFGHIRLFESKNQTTKIEPVLSTLSPNYFLAKSTAKLGSFSKNDFTNRNLIAYDQFWKFYDFKLNQRFFAGSNLKFSANQLFSDYNIKDKAFKMYKKLIDQIEKGQIKLRKNSELNVSILQVHSGKKVNKEHLNLSKEEIIDCILKQKFETVFVKVECFLSCFFQKEQINKNMKNLNVIYETEEDVDSIISSQFGNSEFNSSDDISTDIFNNRSENNENSLNDLIESFYLREVSFDLKFNN